jgi:hypothetical protein
MDIDVWGEIAFIVWAYGLRHFLEDASRLFDICPFALKNRQHPSLYESGRVR